MKNKIYCFIFPIEDGDRLKQKHVYFVGSRCPTHGEVVRKLTELKDKESLKAIDHLEYHKLPCLNENHTETKAFCMFPNWGRHAISLHRVKPEWFEKL